MHTVHIGISCYNHFVVTQSFDSVFYIQGCLEQVEFFVLVHHFLCQPERIQRFTTEAEYRLCVDITALGDGTACRVSLGDEDAGIFFQPFSFRVVEVDTAVTQFAVMQVSFLGTFAGQFRYACNGFAFLFRFLYLLLDGFGYVRILVEDVLFFIFLQFPHFIHLLNLLIRLYHLHITLPGNPHGRSDRNRFCICFYILATRSASLPICRNQLHTVIFINMIT